MVNKVFPVIMKFLEKSRGSTRLPLPTRMVIWLNDFLTDYGVFVLALPFVAVALIVLLRRNPETGEIVDRLSLKIPMLGGAFVFHANTMWCLTLGALLRSGLDVVSAVELVERTMGNWHYAAQFRKMRDLLRQGSSLGKSMSATTLQSLSPMAHTMVSVSEDSGGIDESLMHVAAYSEEQLNRRVALLSKMVEPAIFVVVGGMVGLVYFGFFMAMVQATSAAR
jgi:type IV pilus assembly protein PilC